MIHVDVMDGRFVPNITFGPVVVKACRRATALPLDAHLMVEDAEPYLDAFADAGATSISVHVEAVRHLQRAIAHLRERGVSPGVALNPATPIAALDEILPELDYVLVMSVNPGFSYQKLLPATLDKLRRLRDADPRPRPVREAAGGRRHRRREHPRGAWPPAPTSWWWAPRRSAPATRSGRCAA